MKKAIVVDLDGTLLRTNTFVHYIKYVCKKALLHGNVFVVIWICLLVFLRKIRMISSHENLKRRILACSKQYSKEDNMQELALELSKYENLKVLSIMDIYKEKGYAVVLSSAAPEGYAKWIAKQYMFDFVCATKMSVDRNWRENVGEVKMQNTLSLLEEKVLTLSVLITDHYDDLPLLRIEKEANFVVNPTEETKKRIEESHIKCEYIYG